MVLTQLTESNIPGRFAKQGQFFLNRVASTAYIQIVQFFDMLRKIGYFFIYLILKIKILP